MTRTDMKAIFTFPDRDRSVPRVPGEVVAWPLLGRLKVIMKRIEES